MYCRLCSHNSTNRDTVDGRGFKRATETRARRITGVPGASETPFLMELNPYCDVIVERFEGVTYSHCGRMSR